MFGNLNFKNWDLWTHVKLKVVGNKPICNVENKIGIIHLDFGGSFGQKSNANAKFAKTILKFR